MLGWCGPARSIPACAGEPAWGSLSLQCMKVYPRVCGGTWSDQTIDMAGEGLSPRVRGNRPSPALPAGGAGSIPACAGEPGTTRTSCIPAWVYPRVCGGTVTRQAAGGHLEGLSPRVRGNRYGSQRAAVGAGSIPACAGEPLPGGQAGRPPGVYPRVCGGTFGGADADPAAQGLSPRVRGNLSAHIEGAVPHRSIPACAGEPRTPAWRR